MKYTSTPSFLLFLSLMLTGGVPRESEAEVFSSVQHLTQVFAVERKIVHALSQYLSTTEQKLQRIRRYLNDYEQVINDAKMLGVSDSESATTMEEYLAGNPIQAYQLVKRLTINWKHIQQHDPFTDWKDVEKALVTGEVFGFSEMANEEDLQGAAQALVRLQRVYLLNTTDLARGVLEGTQTSAELTAQDCLYLGKHSFNLKLYENALQWFEQAFTLASIEQNRTVNQGQISSFIDAAQIAHRKANDNPQNNRKRADYKMKLHSLSMAKMKESEEAKKKVLSGENLTDTDNFYNYETLCRGEQFLREAYVSKLKCYLDTRNSAYFTLMPMKTEVRHIDPQVLVFHDVISDREIASLKQVSRHQLSRAHVRSPNSSLMVTDQRISKVAWLSEQEHEDFSPIINRIHALTGLNVDSVGAERLQICNYGTGGFYYPHYDYFRIENIISEDNYKLRGNRMATFMFYMSDVKKGGATVFPKLGVSLFPEKGSAAFWYNLRKSGAEDSNTLHGACPVLYGSKWVMNMWIREKPQFKTRPCSLDAD